MIYRCNTHGAEFSSLKEFAMHVKSYADLDVSRSENPTEMAGIKCEYEVSGLPGSGLVKEIKGLLGESKAGAVLASQLPEQKPEGFGRVFFRKRRKTE